MSQFNHNPSACSSFADEIVGLACGEIELTGVSPAARTHLALCAHCRNEVVQTQDLLAEVGALLAPMPVSARARALLEQRLSAAPSTRVAMHGTDWRMPVFRWLACATAAAALLLLYVPLQRVGSQHNGDSAGVVASAALSRGDATAIASYFEQLSWDSAISASTESAASSDDTMSFDVQVEASPERWLPWTSDEDWDLPATVGA